MSNKLFQNMLTQYKKILGKDIGVMDDSGRIIADTAAERIGEYKLEIIEELGSDRELYVKNKYTYKPIIYTNTPEFVLFLAGDDIETARQIAMIAVTMYNMKNIYDEKYNKISFIKNIITDNILSSDIFIRSKELNFNDNVDRITYLIKFSAISSDCNPYEIILNMFPDKNKDFVINLSENEIVLIREVKPETHNLKNYDVEAVARQINDTLCAEYIKNIIIGVGSPVRELKDLSRSFKEAQIALDVSRVFENEKNIINYKNLGIGRIIYQLPTTLCEVFLQEVFKDGSLEALDRESLSTIQCFFKTSLNVSETSRKLFIHRNTLVYRLEKIKKLTGLDLREFEHAITFKVALMVKKYLSSKNTGY